MLQWLRDSIELRRNRMQATRLAIEQGKMPLAQLQRELRFLYEALQESRPIKELADSEGWKQIEVFLSERAMRLWRGLPDKILENKVEEAKADAAYLKSINAFLGLVNKSLFECAQTAQLIDSRAKMLQKLEEIRNARTGNSGG